MDVAAGDAAARRDFRAEATSSGSEPMEAQKQRAQFIVCGNLFEVDSRYVPIKPVGKGAYGVVWCAHASPLPLFRLSSRAAPQGPLLWCLCGD